MGEYNISTIGLVVYFFSQRITRSRSFISVECFNWPLTSVDEVFGKLAITAATIQIMHWRMVWSIVLSCFSCMACWAQRL